MPTKYKLGIYLALATAFISGLANFVNKFAVGAINPPLVFTATKNAGVGLLVIAILVATWKWKKLKNLTKKEWIYLGLIGIIGGSIPFYLYFTGLSMIPAINAALIHKTLVFWVALLAIPFLKEKMSPLLFFAVLLIFAGNLTLGGFKGFTFSQGELMVLGATIFWAVENILAKKILPKVDPDIVVAARMGFGSIILLTAASLIYPQAMQRALILDPTQWFWLTLTMATLLGYVMTWYRALKLAPAITVAAVLTTATWVTNILSALFVTHKMTFDMLWQGGLISLGTALLWWITQREVNKLPKPRIKTSFK